MSSDITTTLLSRAHSPTSTTQIHNSKIKSRPLHLKPSTTSANPSRAQRQQQQQARARQKPSQAPLSAAQKRSLQLHLIPKSEQNYSIYAPLHRLWTAYIQDILSLHDRQTRISSSSAALLSTADFHGAELEVVRCRCVGRVGIKGIVIRDSRFAFRLCTSRNQVRLVPKEFTVFRFVVERPVGGDRESEGGQGGEGKEKGKKNAREDGGMNELSRNLVFELHGDQFRFRAADRANKKFKPHFLKDL